MNYFELYPGDYLRDTGTLSALEHGCYMLLMLSYYSTEDGLPTDSTELFLITKALDKATKEATLKVARRFFVESDGRLRSDRIEADITKARERQERARSNGSRGGRPRKENPEETQQKPSGFSVGSQNETQKKAHQTPDPNNPVGRSEASAEISQGASTDAERACQLLRAAGCTRVNPSHADLLAALGEGVTPESIRDCYLENPGATNPFAYAIATARGRHAAGAKPAPGANHAHANGGTGRKLSAVEQVQQAILERRAREQSGEDAALQLGHG